MLDPELSIRLQILKSAFIVKCARKDDVVSRPVCRRRLPADSRAVATEGVGELYARFVLGDEGLVGWCRLRVRAELCIRHQCSHCCCAGRNLAACQAVAVGLDQEMWLVAVDFLGCLQYLVTRFSIVRVFDRTAETAS